MKKYKKHIIIGAVVLILLVSIIYYLYASNKGKDIPQEVKQPGITPPSSTAPKADIGNDSFPLKVGSKGENVRYLQSALKKLGANIIVDSDFGQQTYSAILLTINATSYPVTQEIFTAILKKANNS